MQKIIAVLLLLIGTAPALAGEPEVDTYVACVVGNSVVGMNDGLKVEDARAKANVMCEPLYPLTAADEQDGLSDFLYHLIWDISESSMLPPQPDNTPMDIEMGN